MSTSLFNDDLWFMDRHLDVEYQTYRLLAYLQHVRTSFIQIKLYPYLKELIRHYEFLDTITSRMNEINERLGGDLDDEVTSYMYEMTDIIKDKVRGVIEEGISLFNVVLKGITYEVVGIVPEYKEEGYIITSYEGTDCIDVLGFQVSKIVTYDKLYITSIELLEHLDSVSRLLRAPEFVKDYLLGKYKDMPNPVVLHVRVAYYVPLQETLIPIIKRVLPVWLQRM